MDDETVETYGVTVDARNYDVAVREHGNSFEIVGVFFHNSDKPVVGWQKSRAQFAAALRSLFAEFEP